ncbi:hypothetical protein G7Y79_00014g037020 [Physcia stellaris]|nr:hypothetical protein G7Y79_00014g037020 [Physcia stellaris]
MAVVESSMHFLVRDELYNEEKPFQLKFTPEDGVPRSNYRLEKRDCIKIISMRGHEKWLSLEKNGFTVVKMNQETPYTDFETPEGIQAYFRTVVQSVQALLGADKVQVFSYGIRRRDPGFPLKQGREGYENHQPSTMVHIDTSFEGAASTCEQVLRDPTCQRYQIVKYVLGSACTLQDRIALTGRLVFESLCEDRYETDLLRSATQLPYLRLIS